MAVLRHLQNQFISALDDIKSHKDIATTICSTSTLSAEQRLAVYRGSITANLIRALQEVYPVCEKLVGKEFFAAMAEVYIEQTPSKSVNLASYGEAFPCFISNFTQAKSLPYLSDVARLEFAWFHALLGPNNPTLNVQALASIDEDEQARIIFLLPRGSSLLQSEYPIHRIWEVNQEGYQGEVAVNLDEGSSNVIVWRTGEETRIDLLNKDEWCILSALAESMELEVLCERVATDNPSIDVINLLPRLVQQGWIGGFTLHAPD